MITTTLNRIRECAPCQKGWEKLLKSLSKTKADDEVLPFSVILESNGLEDALWCCRVEPQYASEWRLFAVWCARRVQHLVLDYDPDIPGTLEVAERYAHGKASDQELFHARKNAFSFLWLVAWRDAGKAALGTSEAALNTIKQSCEVLNPSEECKKELQAQTKEFLRVVTETEAREPS